MYRLCCLGIFILVFFFSTLTQVVPRFPVVSILFLSNILCSDIDRVHNVMDPVAQEHQVIDTVEQQYHVIYPVAQELHVIDPVA